MAHWLPDRDRQFSCHGSSLSVIFGPERDGRDGEGEVVIQNKVPSQSPRVARLARLARLAISRLTVSDVNEAIKHLFAAARQIGAVGWATRIWAGWLHLHV